MRVVIVLLLTTYMLCAQSILVLNSNGKIERYKSMESSFSKSMDKGIKHMDICDMSKKEVKEYLYDEYPDIVYAIGTKAYQYAYTFIPEKKIFFSSIVNYKRLNMGKRSYGVSNELHTGMQLTLIKSLLSHTKTLGMVYSSYTKDVYKSMKKEAKHVGIEVIGVKIEKGDMIDMKKLQSADVFMMIADPVLIKDEQQVKVLFEGMKQANKPVIAYHPLYIKYGAVMVLSIDTATIGLQVASMIQSSMHGVLKQKIQMPVGSEVIFNQGLAKRMHLHYDKSALSVVNKVIK